MSGSAEVWAQAKAKRLDFSGLQELLQPDESPASWMVKSAGTRDNLRRVFDLSEDEIELLVHDLDFWARRNQVPPSSYWEICFALGGRGYGKTWAGSRWAIKKAKEGKSLGALIGPTAADVRDTMIKGPSGILALSPPWFMPVYQPSLRRLTWPNGVYATCFSADKYDRLRGPNTGWTWGDEPATWKAEMAALDQIPLFNRIGSKEFPPQLFLTGTPRPLKKLESVLYGDEAPEKKILKPGVALLSGSSLSNRAFLAPSTVRNMESIQHTRWGMQEVGGKLLLDVPGAIFGSARFVNEQGDPLAIARTLDRVVIAVDPAPTSETGSDESGIIVEGAKNVPTRIGDRTENLKHVWVLKDCSERASPREWAATAIRAYVEFGASAIVPEVNTGGELVEQLLKSVARELGVEINVEPVRAKEQKSKRAEPVAALAESGRIHLVGQLPKLRHQIDKFTGQQGKRDDRVDAMNWGIHHLVFGDEFFWA